ncbi:hypothetical protein [Bacteroides sp.]|uniref:hypothetical protein n=1 Tax=Bacteroides sp. TaxID=29523 RepID=UPI002630407C|nr:hypothetical protein [Bacteroides sp.]MDD3036965.1 hypothetical protein [Bacteroides sp.]
MNSIFRLLSLHFDRSFSGKGWKQLSWLFGIILFVFGLIFILSLAYNFANPSVEQLASDEVNAPLGRFFQLICLFIDPGNINNVPPSLRWFALLVVVIGMLLFTGLLISVVSNMLERRVERFREGDIDYRLRDHVVIIGFDEMVPTLIQQICSDPHYQQCYILVQSICPAVEIRNKIHTLLDVKNENRIVVLHGRRDSKEDLSKLHTTHAREVFLIGERDEHDHDSLNIDSLKIIVSIHREEEGCQMIPFTVMFEYQTTFAAFQLTDLSAEWRKYIDFHPFNFYEEWAKKLLVSRCYKKGDEVIVYPSLDRTPITEDSVKTVRFVIIGMSRMGVALGVEAAHLLHFPNYCRDNRYKSVITFIDEQADREMNYFRGRYQHFFEIAPTVYQEVNQEGELEIQILPPTKFEGTDADFLDIQFEFIKGRAESEVIQKQLNEWASPESNEILTIAVCLNYPPQSVAIGLYLPDSIFENNIPVFIRQETSSALLSMLSSRKDEECEYHKYSHIYPFGMMDNCYDLDRNGMQKGMVIHYIYDFFNNYGVLPESCPDVKRLEKSWNKLPVAQRWSNLYSACSIDYKLRSVGWDGKSGIELTSKQIELLSQVEHNRWNVEKLLLGFRKPTAAEKKIIDSSKEKKKEYKNERFVHPDICSYEELPQSSKDYDRCIVGGVSLVVDYRQST